MKKVLFVLMVCSLILVGCGEVELVSIPDANFEQALIDLGYDTGTPDGSVPSANISSIFSFSFFRISFLFGELIWYACIITFEMRTA